MKKELGKRYEESGPREKGLGRICRDISPSIPHLDTHTHLKKEAKSNHLEDAWLLPSLAFSSDVSKYVSIVCNTLKCIYA